MTGAEVVNAMAPSIGAGVKSLARVVSQHWRFLLFVVVAVGAVYGILEWYRAEFSREIVVLAGPPGSSGARMAKRIADSIRTTERVPGVRFAVRIDDTSGLYDMVERVRNNQEGNIVGFDTDRSDHAKDLRTLVPLDYDYLHVLCRTRFLVDEGLESAVYHFEDILPQVRRNRVFAGPPKSGTRRLAELIFGQYCITGIKFEQLLTPHIVDWEQARAALKNDGVDLVFYTGPIGATTIRDIANDQTAVLLDLDEIHESLAADDKSSLWPVSFPRNAYTAAKWPRTRGLADTFVLSLAPPGFTVLPFARPSPGEFRFCPTRVHTFAVRRLLVCAPTMSPDDAYLIAQAAQSELTDVGALVGKWETVPPGSVAATDSSPLGIPAHPNATSQPAQWYRFHTWPVGWVSTVVALALVVFKSLGALIKESIGPRLPPARRTAADAVSDVRTSRATDDGLAQCAGVMRDLDALLNETERLRPDELSHDDWERFEIAFEDILKDIVYKDVMARTPPERYAELKSKLETCERRINERKPPQAKAAR